MQLWLAITTYNFFFLLRAKSKKLFQFIYALVSASDVENIFPIYFEGQKPVSLLFASVAWLSCSVLSVNGDGEYPNSDHVQFSARFVSSFFN